MQFFCMAKAKRGLRAASPRLVACSGEQQRSGVSTWPEWGAEGGLERFSSLCSVLRCLHLWFAVTVPKAMTCSPEGLPLSGSPVSTCIRKREGRREGQRSWSKLELSKGERAKPPPGPSENILTRLPSNGSHCARMKGSQGWKGASQTRSLCHPPTNRKEGRGKEAERRPKADEAGGPPPGTRTRETSGRTREAAPGEGCPLRRRAGPPPPRRPPLRSAARVHLSFHEVGGSRAGGRASRRVALSELPNVSGPDVLVAKRCSRGPGQVVRNVQRGPRVHSVPERARSAGNVGDKFAANPLLRDFSPCPLPSGVTTGVSALEVYTPKEIFVANGTQGKLTCKFKSTNTTGTLTTVSWSFQPEGADTTVSFFHYSQGQVYPGNYPPFKDRISWAGDLDKKDASINIENMQFIHNGTYICDVKNPPDIVAQPGHIRLYVVEKEILPVFPVWVVVGTVTAVVVGVILLVTMVLAVLYRRRNSKRDYTGAQSYMHN
uniref:Ig-like domain-containing protein n=1 Tax=Rhinolophus ferrumequinum TaxID=59479 RepID=A0A671FWH1_RHIFE